MGAGDVRANKIKQMWKEGKPVTLGWLSINNSFSAEVMARQGFDALCVDLQHGTNTTGDLIPMLQAISQTETVPVVRVPWNEPSIIMKALDYGAYGIIVPLISTPADAAAAVAACRYPPKGYRSSGPIRAQHYGGADYLAKADDEVVVIAMIETKEGLANLDAICATPGLDAVYIGPADLSLALGCTPRFDQDEAPVVAAIDHILSRARAHGVVAGIHNGSADYALRMVAKGFQFVTVGSDARFMAAGARAAVDRMKAQGGAAAGTGY